jgi:hypothetical protein
VPSEDDQFHTEDQEISQSEEDEDGNTGGARASQEHKESSEDIDNEYTSPGAAPTNQMSLEELKEERKHSMQKEHLRSKILQMRQAIVQMNDYTN